MKIFIYILAIAFNLQACGMADDLSLENMPQEVIRFIANALDRQHDINSLAATCRRLHATATQENKMIRLACSSQRGDLSVKRFLDKVFLCIQHIVARQGNNEIKLQLSADDLAEDMKAVAEFMNKCSQEHIVRNIVSIELEKTFLRFLPEEIKGLAYLKEFRARCNSLTRKDLEILESLKRLETVDIDFNKLTNRDIFQTIARMPSIRNIHAFCNPVGDEFTEQDVKEMNDKLTLIFLLPSEDGRMLMPMFLCREPT